MVAKYFNPYTDFGFKKLFGEEGSKDLLIDFLNQLLPLHHQIQQLTFKNPENLSDTIAERKAIFDIYCESRTGDKFIVEMQKAKIKYFKDRALFYSTFPIREQSEKGDWNFQLLPIYFIAILDFEYDEQATPKFRRDVCLKDQDGDIFFDKLNFKQDFDMVQTFFCEIAFCSSDAVANSFVFASSAFFRTISCDLTNV
jgi:hypothetical protein